VSPRTLRRASTRAFKFDLIERGNPDWQDLYDVIIG
jgi:hypothetical protein